MPAFPILPVQAPTIHDRLSIDSGRRGVCCLRTPADIDHGNMQTIAKHPIHPVNGHVSSTLISFAAAHARE